MTTADDLRAAAARIRAGWCQGAFARTDGVCALGALAKVCGDEGTFSEPRYYAARAALWHVIRRNIPDWNDAPDQTAENVAASLDYAALVSEQEAQREAIEA